MSDKLYVRVDADVLAHGEIVELPQDVLEGLMALADWSDDPGTGKAILTPGGREILSPVPVAPPIGYVHEESAMDRLARMLEARILNQLRADDIIDETEEEALDFDVPDPEDLWPRSVYEVDLLDEAPRLRKVDEPSKVVQGELSAEPKAEPESGANGSPPGAV